MKEGASKHKRRKGKKEKKRETWNKGKRRKGKLSTGARVKERERRVSWLGGGEWLWCAVFRCDERGK